MAEPPAEWNSAIAARFRSRRKRWLWLGLAPTLIPIPLLALGYSVEKRSGSDILDPLLIAACLTATAWLVLCSWKLAATHKSPCHPVRTAFGWFLVLAFANLLLDMVFLTLLWVAETYG